MKGAAIKLTPRNHWRPQPDLNRCCRRERPVSLARLDDGDDIDVNHTDQNSLSEEKSMIIKPGNNPQVNHQRRKNQYYKGMTSYTKKCLSSGRIYYILINKVIFPNEWEFENRRSRNPIWTSMSRLHCWMNS